jgi:Cu(I)/Ag(I) efflux system membrane protein CusA/SilA
VIAAIIAYSVRNRFLVLLLTALLTVLGVWGMRRIRLDAIPDLSDVQVIVVTESRKARGSPPPSPRSR